MQPVNLLSGDCIRPHEGSAAHFLIGEMLSAVRYVKGRKRARHLTCWRFLSAKMNARLRCFLWDGNPGHFPQSPLSTWDYTALDRRIMENTRLEVLDLLDCSTPQKMDAALLRLTQDIFAEVQPAVLQKDSPAAAVAEKYLSFIAQELALPA